MKDNRDKYDIIKALSMLNQLGLSMASCVIVGLLIGKCLDSLLDTSPLLLLIFAFVGAVAGFKVLYDIIKDWNE